LDELDGRIMAARTPTATQHTAAAVADVIRVGTAVARRRSTEAPSIEEVLVALTKLRGAQKELAALEPTLIAAARARGVSWQTLAPILGVASRQAAERRYLRLRPGLDDAGPDTREGRVQAERDRRAGERAVGQWANDHTADLRGLAGQITALTDLDNAASGDLLRLHRALGDADATALPALLASTHQHLLEHPHLADQVARVSAKVSDVRRRTQRRRDGRS
jgi:hypothetical protein